MDRFSSYCATVTTLKNPGPVLCSFIEYHLYMGFDHIFLFFDDPQDDAIEIARRYERVTVILHDEELRRKWRDTTCFQFYRDQQQYIDTEVVSRQVLNVEIAIGMALDMGIEWLLHIDHDELFFSPNCDVKSHFQELLKSNLDTMAYPNFEALPESAEINNYFREVTLFKKNSVWMTSSQMNRAKALRDSKALPPFLGYEWCKSAGRVSKGLLPFGAHEFTTEAQLIGNGSTTRSPRRGFALQKENTPVILHYNSCGFTAFWEKYRTLGDFDDKWFGFITIEDLLPFHTEARDVVQGGDRKTARSFFEGRCVMLDPERTAQHIEAGLLCRIADPASFLNAAQVPSPKRSIETGL